MNAKSRRLTPADIIRREYTDPVRSEWKGYNRVGLWPPEEVLIRRFFPPGGRILDIGCGAGRTAVELSRRGFTVTGIDLIPEMIAAARRQADRTGAAVDWRVMDASRLEFPDEAFDHAIFAYNGYSSIMNKADRIRVLAEVHRVLRPGGFFILAVRSGLAFGPAWLGLAWTAVREVTLKPLGLTNPAFGIGDIYRRGLLHHQVSPFFVLRQLRRRGFEIAYFNSGVNTIRNRPAGALTPFSRDTSLFYVGRKPVTT